MVGVKKRQSGWIRYVKKLAELNGVSYATALTFTKDPEIKARYYASRYYKGPPPLSQLPSHPVDLPLLGPVHPGAQVTFPSTRPPEVDLFASHPIAGVGYGGARRRGVRTCVRRSNRGPSGLKRCVRYRTVYRRR